MDKDFERAVTSTLQGSVLHESWTNHYRMPENEAFYDLAFDYIASVFGQPGEVPVLDAGCGSSTKSIHLAKRGYRVTGIDVSHSILNSAAKAVAKLGLSEQVCHQWADLTQLPFADGAFQRVLCWGVLMHVPNVDDAISELVRTTDSGGRIVISEANFRSVQAAASRWAGKLRKCRLDEMRYTASGLEFWEHTADGKLVTRQADIGWLIRTLESHGARLLDHRAGQFTELFTRFRSPYVRRLIHNFNAFWFRTVGRPGPAFGNILVFEKLRSG